MTVVDGISQKLHKLLALRYMHVYIEYFTLSTALIWFVTWSWSFLSFELTGCCWLQVVASSCDSALSASLTHGLQRSFQETGGRRQHGGQEIHGGQWASSGGTSTHSTETPAHRTPPDASHYTNNLSDCSSPLCQWPDYFMVSSCWDQVVSNWTHSSTSIFG